jgi:hypothetical protein
MDKHKELFENLYGRPVNEVTNEDIYTELRTAWPGKGFDERIRQLANTANDKTADLRAARDAAFKTYCRISEAFNLTWKEAWAAARAEMILEGTNGQTDSQSD